MTVLDESLEPPEREDFRRVNRGVPLVMNVDTGKWDRYRRSSGAGNMLDDDSQLVDWRIRTIIEGAAQRPDLMAQVSVLDHDEDKGQIRDIAEECLIAGKGTQRATTGTAIHKMLDHVDLGHDWTPAPQFKAAVDSYVRMLDLYGLVPVDVEVHCVHDHYRLAGTMDRRYRTTRNLVTPTGEIIPIGTIVAADTKTGQSLEYASGSYVTQLAAYAGSVRYDVKTNERSNFDPPTYQDWALIIHVDADDGRTDVYFADLEAGRHALALADQVRQWRKRTDLITPARAPLHAVRDQGTSCSCGAHTLHGSIIEVAGMKHAPNACMPCDEYGSVAPAAGVDVDALVRAARDRHPATMPPDTSQSPVAAVGVPPVPSRPHDGNDGLAAVRAWLRDRIAAVRAAGPLALNELQRRWPAGVPGLKHDTQTEDQLDAISEALHRVETDWSLSFPGNDPRTPETSRDFVGRWSKPTGDDRPPDLADAVAFREAIERHPRRALLHAWSDIALKALEPSPDDGWSLAHALYEFAMLPLDQWADADVTEMLDGTLRAIGYDGIGSLGTVAAEHAPHIMSSAFAITAGNALLLYDEDGKPVVRTIN